MRTACVFCGQRLDSDAVGVYQLVTGWERRRSGGGTNAIRLPQRHPRWACHGCVEAQTTGTADAPRLF